MKKSVVSIAALLIAGCSQQGSPKQIAYFKSPVNDRIFTASYSGEITAEQAKSWATGKKHTDGQMTAVYIYPSDQITPVDGVTLAANTIQATENIFASNMGDFRFVLMRYRNGKTDFKDCSLDKSELCR